MRFAIPYLVYCDLICIVEQIELISRTTRAIGGQVRRPPVQAKSAVLQPLEQRMVLKLEEPISMLVSLLRRGILVYSNFASFNNAQILVKRRRRRRGARRGLSKRSAPSGGHSSRSSRLQIRKLAEHSPGTTVVH